MAYLGRKGASAALTSADIPNGSISAVKVAADVATQAEIDLKANLASPTLVTPNLGTPSAITLTNATFPAGHITKIFYNTDTSGDMNTTANSGTFTIACTPISFTTVSGRKYIIIGTQQLATSNETGSNHNNRVLTFNIYYGTTSRAKSDTTVDTLLVSRTIGRSQSENTTAGRSQYIDASYTAYFTAASSATHYVYTTICNDNSTSQKNYGHNDADRPHTTIVYEVMP